MNPTGVGFWRRMSIAAAILLLSATALADGPVMSTKYFESFATDYSLPFSPRGEITVVQALGRRSYCIGEYSDGKLVGLVKFLDGKRFFEHRYTYHANGKLQSAKVTNADGVVSYRQFDQAGRVIEPPA